MQPQPTCEWAIPVGHVAVQDASRLLTSSAKRLGHAVLLHRPAARQVRCRRCPAAKRSRLALQHHTGTRSTADRHGLFVPLCSSVASTCAEAKYLLPMMGGGFEMSCRADSDDTCQPSIADTWAVKHVVEHVCENAAEHVAEHAVGLNTWLNM